jgi:DNA modification methylase
MSAEVNSHIGGPSPPNLGSLATPRAFWGNGVVDLFHGDAREVLKAMQAESVHMAVTSPPYFGLRDYGLEPSVWGGDAEHGHDWGADVMKGRNGAGGERDYGSYDGGVGRGTAPMPTASAFCPCGAWRGNLGIEPTPELFVEHLVEVFREVWRVLRPDGTLWVNLGSSYAASGMSEDGLAKQRRNLGPPRSTPPGLKPKDLVMIPARVAMALQADGWYLRSDIIWCLSGGTRVYARTQKGDMPMTIKDLVRLNPSTVKLWDGARWTQATGWSESSARDGALEIELRSGERIGSTPHHMWPVGNDEIRADQLKPGDVITSTTLPDPDTTAEPENLMGVGWFVGLYLAEGSRSGATIQIASHTKETDRVERLRKLVTAFHGTLHVHQTSSNGMTINIESLVLNGVLDTYLAGRVAKDKHLTRKAWARSRYFLGALMEGYLNGDAAYDKPNDRWRLGFTRNTLWAADLRTLCARLGWQLRLKPGTAKIGGRAYPIFRGEIRIAPGAHHNTKADSEVMAIRKGRGRKFWHIGVEDAPHQYALASGVLTCNSKPNPMPESVRDRPTTAHEHLFLLAKSPKYFYDADAIREPHSRDWWNETVGPAYMTAQDGRNDGGKRKGARATGGRNKWSVWEVATQPMGWEYCGCGAVYDQKQYGRLRGGATVRCKAEIEGEQACGSTAWEYAEGEFVCLSCGQVYTTGQHAKLPKAPVCRQCDRDDQWGSHFATFPEKLVEPCILAGTSERGVCSECGAPWERVVERDKRDLQREPAHTPHSAPTKVDSTGWTDGNPRTTGWRPTCPHPDAPTEPATVLDIFAGSCTTGLVAQKLGRKAVLVDASVDYLRMGQKRLEAIPLPML